MRAILLIAALLIATPLHAEEKPLMGCWAQDYTGVVRAPDKEYTEYRICFLPNKGLSIYSVDVSKEVSWLKGGDHRQRELGTVSESLQWDASQNKLHFAPTDHRGQEFSCDFTLTGTFDKLNVSHCAPDEDWNGLWLFDKGLTDATNEELAKHK